MKAANISQIKKEMKNRTGNELLEMCLRLARFKKENKELLTYLLFEKNDEQAYIKSVKNEMEQQFQEINKSNIYYIRKSIRKIVRTTNKYIRYSGCKQTEVELLIHFCKLTREYNIPINKSVALNNIYIGQIQKVKKTVATLHEDLQYDYGEEIKLLN